MAKKNLAPGGTAVLDQMAGGAGHTADLEEGRSDAMSRGAGRTTDRPASGEPMTLQQAFALAKEKHSTPAGVEQANGDEASPVDDTETDEDDATPGAQATTTGTTTVTAGDTELISDADFEALREKHKDDPAALKKDLLGVFTKKTQALAAKRTSLERLTPYTTLVDALESDDPAVAQAAVRRLAQEYGLTSLVPDTTDGDRETTAETSEATSEKLLNLLKEKLGPELDYMAEGLLPGIQETVKALLKTELTPLRTLETEIKTEKAEQRTTTVMKAFADTHADWQTHEEAMVGLMERLAPTKGMTELEYLDALYTIVTAPKTADDVKKRVDAAVAKGVKAHVDKLNRGAADADQRVEGAPDSQVTQRRPEGAGIREAYEAAKNGIRWAD